MTEETRDMDECPKIQVDEGLKVLDCQSCPERSYCGFRAVSLKKRFSSMMSRVYHIHWLHEAKDWIGSMVLLSWEVRFLVEFERALNKAESESLKRKN